MIYTSDARFVLHESAQTGHSLIPVFSSLNYEIIKLPVKFLKEKLRLH